MDSWKHREANGGTERPFIMRYTHKSTSSHGLDTSVYAAHGKQSNVLFLDGHVAPEAGLWTYKDGSQYLIDIWKKTADQLIYRSEFEEN